MEEEEAKVVEFRRKPKGPNWKEREEHDATHIPYRDWYPHCVKGVPGRGRTQKAR